MKNTLMDGLIRVIMSEKKKCMDYVWTQFVLSPTHFCLLATISLKQLNPSISSVFFDSFIIAFSQPSIHPLISSSFYWLYDLHCSHIYPSMSFFHGLTPSVAGDDHQALIWDIQQMPRAIEDPILAYTAGGEINQIQWSSTQPDWISICYNNCMEILRV